MIIVRNNMIRERVRFRIRFRFMGPEDDGFIRANLKSCNDILHPE